MDSCAVELTLIQDLSPAVPKLQLCWDMGCLLKNLAIRETAEPSASMKKKAQTEECFKMAGNSPYRLTALLWLPESCTADTETRD